MNELLNALHAVDRLNSWVRSDSFRHTFHSSSLRRVIYHFKRQAIVRASTEMPCEHGAFIHQVECRDCRGTGHYEDQYGHIHNHCWACGNSGVAKLHFVESRIGEQSDCLFAGARYLFIWHHPADKFPSSIPLKSEGSAGDNWHVNHPGRDMTPEEAAECLNIAHEVFRDPIPKHYSYDYYNSYVTDDSQYSLWIGSDDPRCAHCGIELDPNKHRCHKTSGRVEFNFFVCAGCKASLTHEQQWNVPVPKHLWGHGYGCPHINAWIVRQNAFAERKSMKVEEFA